MTNEKLSLLNTEETYRSLQPFATIEELNANTTEIRAQFADQMTPATYAVLDVLHRYASKYYGVSYRSKAKIAADLGVNRSTVIRACNFLESIGVIEQFELRRHNGDRRQSSNAIVFVKVTPEVDSVADATPQCNAKDAPNNPLKDLRTTYVTCACGNSTNENVVKKEETEVTKSAVKVNDKPKDDVPKAEGNKELLKDSLPDGWYEEAFAYTTDYNDLYRITGELFKAKVNTTVRIETHVSEFGEVLRSAYGRLKNGRINPAKWYAYLFHAFRRKAVALERGESVNRLLNIGASLFDEPYEA